MNPFPMTRWSNPTKHVAKFEIFESPGEIHKIEISPGGEADIPAKYDNAVRTVRDGVVVGGLAPLLVPVNGPRVPVHDAIGRSALAGDDERALLSTTGTTAGGMTLDAALALQAQNRELSAKLEELSAKFSALAAAQQQVSAPSEEPQAPAAPPAPILTSPQPQQRSRGGVGAAGPHHGG